MKSFIRLPVFFLFSALCGWSSISSAGFAQVKVPGFQSGSGGYSYQGSSPANAGSFWTAGSIIVAGKTIDLGVAVPLAANMAEFAVGVARGNPAWIAAGAVAAWLLPYGIQWIAGQWQMVQSSVPVGSTAGYWYSNSWSSFGGACSVKYGPKPGMSDAVSCGFARWPGGPVGASGNCSDLGTTAVNCSIEHYGVYTVQFNYTANVCTGDQLWINGACQTPGSTSHPVTDAEWAEVKAHPVPDSVPDEIADHQPVPVQTPQIEPKVVPISQPYLNPQGQPVQDIVQITPAPEVGPDYVDIKTGTEALPSSTPIPNESDPNHPNVTPDPEPDMEKFCESNPDVSACSPLGTPADAEQIPTVPKSVNGIQPVNIGGGGSCPSPIHVSFMGRGLTVSWDLICQFAGSIRPIVIGLAWFFAGSAFLFGARRHG